MKIGDVSMSEIQSVYGPPTEPFYSNGNNNGVKNNNNNMALAISNILITAALLILGVIAIFNKKLSKKSKIFILIGIVAVGALIIFLLNTKLN